MSLRDEPLAGGTNSQELESKRQIPRCWFHRQGLRLLQELARLLGHAPVLSGGARDWRAAAGTGVPGQPSWPRQDWPVAFIARLKKRKRK